MTRTLHLLGGVSVDRGRLLAAKLDKSPQPCARRGCSDPGDAAVVVWPDRQLELRGDVSTAEFAGVCSLHEGELLELLHQYFPPVESVVVAIDED